MLGLAEKIQNFKGELKIARAGRLNGRLCSLTLTAIYQMGRIGREKASTPFSRRILNE